MDGKLVIGMPAGSLADPKRGGNVVDLLKAAGFPVRGYEHGGPSDFPFTAMLFGWDGRPQEFGSQLALGELDVAIAGDDWVQERVLEYRYAFDQTIALERVLPLRRGGVRIVIICNPIESTFDTWLTNLLREKPLVSMVSEMPYTALDWFRRKKEALGFGGSHNAFSVQKYRTPPRIESGIVLYEAWGKTESKVKNGGVDFGMELTQTGSALRNYGLAVGEDVLRSETAIFISPRVKTDPQKYELAKMFVLNLYGAVFAENKVLMLFNAKKNQVPKIEAYLREHQLFADEPTITDGVNFTEFSVQMDTRNPALPVARVRYELAKLGATHLETVPLESCIPGLDAIDF